MDQVSGDRRISGEKRTSLLQDEMGEERKFSGLSGQPEGIPNSTEKRLSGQSQGQGGTEKRLSGQSQGGQFQGEKRMSGQSEIPGGGEKRLSGRSMPGDRRESGQSAALGEKRLSNQSRRTSMQSEAIDRGVIPPLSQQGKKLSSGPEATKSRIGSLTDRKSSGSKKGGSKGAGSGLLKGSSINERTYQEVEYLKKNLGPILVAALAEICIRRPADPIEYLGHWLLRWRYNEELKRRDVQNALDVIKERQWARAKDESEEPKQPPEIGQGFVPDNPYGPPGYGGPLTQNEWDEDEDEDEGNEVVTFAGEEYAEEEGEGMMAFPNPNTKRASQEGKRLSKDSQRGSVQGKRVSGEGNMVGGNDPMKPQESQLNRQQWQQQDGVQQQDQMGQNGQQGQMPMQQQRQSLQQQGKMPMQQQGQMPMQQQGQMPIN